MKIKKYKSSLIILCLLTFILVDMYFIMKDFGVKYDYGVSVVSGFKFKGTPYYLNFDNHGNFISYLIGDKGYLSFYYSSLKVGRISKIMVKIEPSYSNKNHEKNYDPAYKFGVVAYPKNTFFVTGYYPDGKIRYKSLVQKLGYKTKCMWFYGYDKKGQAIISIRKHFYYSGLFCLDFSREIKGPYVWNKKKIDHPVWKIGMLEKKTNEE